MCKGTSDQNPTATLYGCPFIGLAVTRTMLHSNFVSHRNVASSVLPSLVTSLSAAAVTYMTLVSYLLKSNKSMISYFVYVWQP